MTKIKTEEEIETEKALKHHFYTIAIMVIIVIIIDLIISNWDKII